MMKKLLCTLLLGSITVAAISQTDRFWSASDESRGKVATDKAVARQSYPTAFKLFSLNFDAFKNEALSITNGRSSNKSTIITLPNADGKMEQFEIYEASNFEP